MASLNARITIPADVLFQTLHGEAVLLDLKSGKYYGLDAVGTRMWSLANELGRPQAIVERMRQEFAVDESRLRQDVLNWVDKLAARGLLTVEESSPQDEIEAP